MELDSRERARKHGGMTEIIARLHIARADNDLSIWCDELMPWKRP